MDKNSYDPLHNHKHSKREICLYSSLHFDLYETPAVIGLIADLNETHKNYFIANDQTELFSPFLKSIPRGPPA